MVPASSARVESGAVRSSRLSASCARAGNAWLIRVWLGRASSSTSPVTYSATSPNRVGFSPTAAATWSVRNAVEKRPYILRNRHLRISFTD